MNEQSFNVCCVPRMHALSTLGIVSQPGFSVHEALSAEGKTRMSSEQTDRVLVIWRLLHPEHLLQRH